MVEKVMSKDTIKEAEALIENLDKIVNEKFNDTEQKIKKGIVQGVLWILVTVAIYFIWGTTWFFWVSFGFNVLTIGGMVFAKVIMAKAKKKMAEHNDEEDHNYDYDFDADILDDEVIISLESKIFGQQKYSSEKGLDFDDVSMILNNKMANFRGMISEDLNEVQIKKAIQLLDSLEVLDAKAREKWLELLEEKDEVVCEFIDIHHDEYGNEVKNQILEKLKVEKQDNKAFIVNLEFGSFHIIEGDEDDSVEIVMDYSLIWEDGASFTDQILAMHFTDKLEYDMHTHDS
jgi:hypothetical protein